MLAPVTTWLQWTVYGLLLAGLLVGLWEWEVLAVRRRSEKGSRIMLALGVPLMLFTVARWGPEDVPYGVLIVVLMSMWYLIPRSRWNLVGSVAMWAVTVVLVLGRHGLAPRSAVELGMMVLLTGILQWNAARPFRWQLGLYVTIATIALLNMVMNHDPARDLWTSAVVAIAASGYLLGRAGREQRWALDIFRAEHDALTGALTRHGLQTYVSRLSDLERGLGLVVACDLDDFKWFNDTWGHHIGDQVLCEVADRLRGELRTEDALVRPGGDEFTVWMPGVRTEDAAAVVSRLHQAISGSPYELAEGTFRIGVSMGWAMGPLSDCTARAADQELLGAKRQGKNRVAATSGAPARNDPFLPGAHLGWLGDAARALWRYWPTAAVLTNAAGRIVAVNPAYEQLTGRSWDDLVGREPGVNSAGETSPDTYRALWSTLNTGQPWHGHLENRRPDGSRWWAEEWIVPVQAGENIVGYWASVTEPPGPRTANASPRVRGRKS